LKICIDIQAAVAQGAGVGRYVRLLAEHLDKLVKDDGLVFFYFDFLRKGLSSPLANARAVRWCPGRIIQSCWKKLGWPPFDWFAGKADLYHFPNFFIPPFGNGKCVVSIHDASFLRHPEFAEKRNLNYLRATIKNTVRRADAIITISHFSARELACFFPEAREKIHVIYPGVMEHMTSYSLQANDQIRQAKGLNQPYILTVSTLEPRKNIEFLVQVFENMTGFQGEMVIVGNRGWKYAAIIDRLRSSPRANEIRFLENISDRELSAIYSGAQLFIFPSFYEGFGFPPLEAFTCGLPVISSTGGSLKEVLGEGALLIKEYDAERWARAAELLLNDKEVRESFIEKGHRQVAQYSWTKTAQQTMALYRRIVG
jgi:glycosyltransferase involved in cell wall biosynthesis